MFLQLQAALVQELKSQEGISKDKIDQEVKKLFDLKVKLEIAPIPWKLIYLWNKDLTNKVFFLPSYL